MTARTSKQKNARGWLLAAAGCVALACSGTVTTGGAESGAGGAGGSPVDGGAAGPAVAGRPSLGGSQALGGSAPTGSAGFSGNGGARHVGPVACESPQFDPQTQLVVCANGFSHRARGGACPVPGIPSAGSAENGGAASAGSDAGGAAGAPMAFSGERGSQCIQDADCASGLLCECGFYGSAIPNACVPAYCKTDADCGAGSFCALDWDLGLGTVAAESHVFACLHADDECLTALDCPLLGSYTVCAVQDGRRVCEPEGV